MKRGEFKNGRYLILINGISYIAYFFEYQKNGREFSYFKFYWEKPVIGAFPRTEIPLEWITNGFVKSEVKDFEVIKVNGK